MPAPAASTPPSPSRKAAAPPALTASAPTLSTSSLSAFDLQPNELIVFPPGALSRVAGVDDEGTLWVELLLARESDEQGDENGTLSLSSTLAPTALRPGDEVEKAPEHTRIDLEASKARRDLKVQQQKRAEKAAAETAAALEQAKQKGRGKRVQR